jgi:hypothetical protein
VTDTPPTPQDFTRAVILSAEPFGIPLARTRAAARALCGWTGLPVLALHGYVAFAHTASEEERLAGEWFLPGELPRG